MQDIFPLVISAFVLIGSGFLYQKSRGLKIDSENQKIQMKRQEEEMKRKMYELAILKELGDRIGYSLNIHKIIDIITGSLKQFIDYSVVSYMLIEPEKILFKADIEKSVHRKFINEIRDRMLKSLSALLNKDISKTEIEETLSGAILIEEVEEPVRSFFNIPLVIGEKVVGILTVAHTAAGLYKEEEMTILYKITNQASQAVTRLQEVVETEEKKLNAMVESIAEGIIMTDKDYKILVVNPAAKTALGFAEKNELSVFNLIDSMEGKFDIRGKLEESVKLNKILESGEILLRDKFFQIFVSPVKTAGVENKTEILGSVVILHDITRKKELDKLRDDFTSMIVHELRSPLDSIKKMSELMQKTDIKKDEGLNKEYPKIVYENSSNMLNLVNGLLDVAKLESGKFKIAPQEINIKNLIEDRTAFFKPLADASRIKINLKSGSNIPEKILADPARISQVLNNFLSNSLKFTENGGKIEIQVIAHLKGWDIFEDAENAGIKWFIEKNDKNILSLENSLLVAITDNGIGINKKNIEKLFNKFEQLQANIETEEKKGTGLGLIIAKGIIESHKGIVGVSSIEGKGSTFYFTLPITVS